MALPGIVLVRNIRNEQPGHQVRVMPSFITHVSLHLASTDPKSGPAPVTRPRFR